ncbi:FAD-binding oxidoreductase [Acidianus sp. HS-5]|uniref:FAD-binding oxidoreductase n=1 Tax=Acidianus sp. HS-5 TaxID=2886040 RepID=UPI001F3864B7|nr:FAD-binding oxidoreductase [Acidianus sp. HS-5]BDC18888.1 FAD binding domain-containing protein [Acidianus sp. HS-5]
MLEVEKILSRYFEVYSDKEILEKYSIDYGYLSPTLSSIRKSPKAVIKVKDEEEIRALMELVKEYHFPIIVRGAGSNTLGETIPIKEGTVVVDITNFKGFERKGGYLVTRPGSEFNEVGIEDLPTIPTSFYMATIGGYVAGGSLGFGSLRNGAVWDNVEEVEVYTPKGFFSLSGNEVRSVVQSAGTTGIVTKIKMRTVKREGKVKVIRRSFRSLNEAMDFSLNILDGAEFISIRNKPMAELIEPERKWSNWNVIAGIYGEGEEASLKDLITTFAGTYFTAVNKTKVSYNSLDIPLEKLNSVEGANAMISCELSRSRGKLFSHTYFLDYDKLPEIEGYTFNLHSYKVNDRVDEYRLKKMIEFKRKVDEEDLLNPGKLVF